MNGVHCKGRSDENLRAFNYPSVRCYRCYRTWHSNIESPPNWFDGFEGTDDLLQVPGTHLAFRVLCDWLTISFQRSNYMASKSIIIIVSHSCCCCVLCYILLTYAMFEMILSLNTLPKKKLRIYARMTALAFQILCFNQKYLAFLVFFHQYWRLVTCAPKEIRTNKKQKHQLNSYGLIWLYKNRIPIARHTNRGRIMNLGRRKKVIKHFFEVASRLVQV